MDRTRITLFGFLLVCATAAPTKKERDVDIYSFHINSTVTSRYAITVITSRVANRLNESKEIHFQVKIPKDAFISKFRMTIEGKMYDGVVKEKEEAKQQYSQAVSRGESAGMVSSVGRTLEEFKTSVTVAAFSKVTFELTYEELLMRRLGKYQLLINAQPMQPVVDFKIDVYIHESPGISFLELKGGLTTKELANAVTTMRSGKEVWVNFYPTREQQTQCDVCGENGLNGDMLIIYDVERPKPSGELQASDGYFVHYFAPIDIQRIPKNVVFVIDRSGSMSGRKMEQTHAALLKILGDLTEGDHFGLITFNSGVEVWNAELLQATERNLNAARDFVKNIEAMGSTDINSAVLKGVEMINKHPQEKSASILILLTDGAPNTGESDPVKIQANVKKAIRGKFPLYCLGFGFDVNFDFLKKMSLENNGLARRIYDDSDADLQLQGFYEEVATPLLTDVQLKYSGAANLTQTRFSHYYNGSEIVVAGKITDNSLDTFQTEVIAISKNSKVTYQDSVIAVKLAGNPPRQESFIRRLWAYLTVKQLLEKEITLTGLEKKETRKEAMNLSLTYNFVTPLTSMVVTKPQGEVTQVAHKPKEGEKKRERESQRKRRPLQSGGGGLSADEQHRTRQIFQNSRFYSRPVSLVRFLISSYNRSQPLCYDLPTGSKIRLLEDPSSGFFMNGELSSKGFKQITVRHKIDDYFILNTSHILYYDGLNSVTLSWEQEPTKQETDSVSLILRNDEMDVTIGTVRVVFLRHKKDREIFLWPAVQQQPNNANIQGILGKKYLQYEELSELGVKIGDKEEKATWSTAIDYSRSSAPVLDCWHLPFKFVLQGELSDFTLS